MTGGFLALYLWIPLAFSNRKNGENKQTEENDLVLTPPQICSRWYLAEWLHDMSTLALGKCGSDFINVISEKYYSDGIQEQLKNAAGECNKPFSESM